MLILYISSYILHGTELEQCYNSSVVGVIIGMLSNFGSKVPHGPHGPFDEIMQNASYIFYGPVLNFATTMVGASLE